VLEAAVQHPAGTYSFAYGTFDREGSWHWHVTATDDLGRQSTDDRVFRYDATLRGLAVPASASKRLAVRFTLTRPAQIVLRIETRSGVLLRALPAVSLPAGAGAVAWDGRLPGGSRAYGGSYVAHLVVTSEVGTSDLTAAFIFRR
jgi:FlgD Ig-like domain